MQNSLNPPLWILLIASATQTIAAAELRAQASPLGQFANHLDVGSPQLAGSAAYNGVTQEYSVSASGFNMWAARDEFHFLYSKLEGDFILQARVEFLGQGVDPHRKAGWIVRSSLDADSPYVDGTVHGDGLTALQYRRAKGAITEQVQTPYQSPDVLQLEKKGNDYTFSFARFGEPFSSCVLTNIDLGTDLHVGLFLCSHNSNVVERAIFRDVRIIRPAKDGFRPYRDYLGSVLEILDVQTGRREMIHQSKVPFEAPNWTPDGNALQFNTSGTNAVTRGRLYHFDLLTRQPTLIDTGFANRLNNDHVLSFDGRTVAISDQTRGGSTIYTLPATGGTPKQITQKTPSYMHGWSPDGKWLFYTGGRSNEFDIYKIAADGSGEEINLTNSPGLDDGPEMTPDGKFIYFNSARSGKMQLWRMNADGSNPRQVTNDEYNNWFPHISPDGKWIAFISFPKDIDPNDHPYYKHTYLRLLPIEGGTPKVIAYVYGGQGTINVPSWSPDSRHVAFVSNTGME
jgi:TolB protein